MCIGETPGNSTRTASDLWLVNGEYYDLAKFVERHPGGKLVLRQTKGHDITPLYLSHHLSALPDTVLKMYKVAAPSDGTWIESHGYSFKEDGYFMTLRRRVQALKLENGKKFTDYNRLAYIVSALTLFCVTQCAVLLVPMAPRLLCLVGLMNAYSRCWLTGIGHEAIHGRTQNWFSWELFNAMMLFPSSTWHFEHCTQHHPDTKREGKDPDEVLVPLRFSHRQEWRPFHLLQLPLHFIVGVIAAPATMIDHHLIRGVQRVKGIVYLFLFHLIPLFFSANSAWWSMFWCSGMATCVTFTLFHVSHINEHSAEAQFVPGVDWGEYQTRSSANFATKWYGITGMLEMQIEHHLFPVLSYNNQLKIMETVQQTSAEFGVPYFCYSSILHGVAELCYYLTVLSFPPGFFGVVMKGEKLNATAASYAQMGVPARSPRCTHSAQLHAVEPAQGELKKEL